MRHFPSIVLVLWLHASMASVLPVNAQSLASSSCGSFKDAQKDPVQLGRYLAYLEGYANVNSPDPRYTTSDAALADDARKALDWCNKNLKSTYGEAVAALLPPPVRTGGPSYVMQSEPTSCRVGPTVYCSGCGVTCPGGKQATCTPGRDSEINQWCGQQSRCICK